MSNSVKHWFTCAGLTEKSPVGIRTQTAGPTSMPRKRAMDAKLRTKFQLKFKYNKLVLSARKRGVVAMKAQQRSRHVLNALPMKIQAFSSNLFPVRFTSTNLSCRQISPIFKPYESWISQLASDKYCNDGRFSRALTNDSKPRRPILLSDRS